MARYWVGGTASWNGTAGTKWATTSGGAGGAAEPTRTDPVFFDAASGPITCNVTANRKAASLNFTGFTGTITGPTSGSGGYVEIAGNLTLGAGMTLDPTYPFYFWISDSFAGTVTGSITTNGKSLTNLSDAATPSSLAFGDGTITLLDDLTSVAHLNFAGSAASTVNFNGKNVTAGGMRASTPTPGSITFGAQTTTLTGSNPWFSSSATIAALSAASATIKFTDASATSKTFEGKGFSYGTVWFSGGGSGAWTIKGSNTFGTLRGDPGMSFKFEAGTTQTVTTWNFSGTGSGSKITLASSTGGSAWNLSKASGTATSTWVSLQDSHAAGGATFTATSSIDVSGNTGWTITPPSSPSGMFMVFSIAAALLAAGAAAAVGPIAGGLALARVHPRRKAPILRGSRGMPRRAGWLPATSTNACRSSWRMRAGSRSTAATRATGRVAGSGSGGCSAPSMGLRRTASRISISRT